MILRMVDVREGVDARGKLEMASSSRHDAQHRGDELEVRLKLGSYETILGTMQIRLADGKLKVWFWAPGEDIVGEFTAEKKEEVFEPFQRVTIKKAQVIAASDVHPWPGDAPV